MNIGEANDLNTLLRYVLNLPGVLDVVPTDEQAREAAERLADKAHKAVMAGLDGERVRAAWPDLLLDNAAADHPRHTECADGCGLAVTHDGACLDRPGGRVVCEHEDDDTMPCGCQEGMHYCENPGRSTPPPPSFEDREAQAAYDDEWIGRRS